MEWGRAGGEETALGATFAVVVDVLSFTTTLSVAMDQGATVYPYRWKDDSAADYAHAHDATLAVGRLEARLADGAERISLSPHTIRAMAGVQRLVLPSPNGSRISFQLAGSGAKVLGACLRNRAAVAGWLSSQLDTYPEAVVTVIAAGETWPDGSLRPAVEDLWGAGAVIAGLEERGVTGLSPEAQAAAATFLAVNPRLGESLMRCSSGRELRDVAFGEDVEVAAELDSSACVPLLVDGRFVDIKGECS